jgi:hypothetical protein
MIGTLRPVASYAVDPNVLRAAQGYLVADVRGRVVGRVEHATAAEDGGRLTVRGRFPLRRRHIVPAAAIEEIDPASGVVALRVGREDLPST